MKTEIKKLIELAKDYVVFGIEISLPDTHNNIRGGHQSIPKWGKEGDLINIYFSNKGETWQITFKDIEISGYQSKIAIPFDADEDYLNKVYLDAKDYLEKYLLTNVAKCKLSVMKERHKEIKDLERKLRTLKSLS